MAELLRKRERVQLSALGLQQVGHVEQHHGGQPKRKNGVRQHKLAVHVHGVEHQEDHIGRGHSGNAAGQNIDGDAGILGVGGQRVDAREVDQRKVAAADTLHASGVVIDGDTRVVGGLLAKAGQPVKECGFAAVRWSHQRDGFEPAAAHRGRGVNAELLLYGSAAGFATAAHGWTSARVIRI